MNETSTEVSAFVDCLSCNSIKEEVYYTSPSICLDCGDTLFITENEF